MVGKTRYIKLFSHNDLDGFGAPALFEAVNNELFKGVVFDLTTCSAGRLDARLASFFRQPDISRFSDIFIMDMTPDSDYSFQQLEQHFANHWLIFDHHESEADLRSKYANNCISPTNPEINPSATSLVWDWLKKNKNFTRLEASKVEELSLLVELIRAYDTWDWQNDEQMAPEIKEAADNLNQLFWFYPLSKTQEFIKDVFNTGWQNYRQANALLIDTLNARRTSYIKKHLKSVTTFEQDGHSFGVVYASDYKSEIAHELLLEFEVDAALVIDDRSVSLRSNGKLDVAKFAEDYFRGGGHEDSAGGSLDLNPVLEAEKLVIDSIKQQKQVNEQMATEQEEKDSLANQLDPETAAKLAALFGNQAG
ncbi:phosphoesterase [Ligilactobacillus agilis]|uniref:Phosphoesterase n=1 Tax=Ligilactobacillus agilis TaxID=1601 RepID=A0A231QJ06_9LACO|nr:phosphoesterase [Ligilactobacillus agilis]OXC08141.1 phosphoesterase [Ligilactobacillus agilis]OXC08147.1 phosphoesterase [Ligilactobacillus agilis]OXC08267.1 phosphoesterase [Ligilactobacillus agilis]OXS38301.1 phosphoesterase [Ligilactobacillus agilis]OXS42275.1 phosphoesterase [Ligilactobacillus agilis]